MPTREAVRVLDQVGSPEMWPRTVHRVLHGDLDELTSPHAGKGSEDPPGHAGEDADERGETGNAVHRQRGSRCGDREHERAKRGRQTPMDLKLSRSVNAARTVKFDEDSEQHTRDEPGDDTRPRGTQGSGGHVRMVRLRPV